MPEPDLQHTKLMQEIANLRLQEQLLHLQISTFRLVLTVSILSVLFAGLKAVAVFF